MQLDVRGHPLHSRGQSITLVKRGDGKLDVFGELVDLRKRGFVPVCGHLQPAGIVHHMQLRGVVDPETLTLESLEAVMPTVAFEPSDTDNGESCRDPAPRLGALAGKKLDADFSRKLVSVFGGPNGCFHVLVLASVDLRTVKLSAVAAAERARTLTDLHTAEWRDRSADVEKLLGLGLTTGVGSALFRHFGDRPEDRPLLDGLLNLTPGMHQCMAVASERWNLSREVVESMAGMHGHPDSCYMWRIGGAHDHLRKSRDAPVSGDAE